MNVPFRTLSGDLIEGLQALKSNQEALRNIMNKIPLTPDEREMIERELLKIDSILAKYPNL